MAIHHQEIHISSISWSLKLFFAFKKKVFRCQFPREFFFFGIPMTSRRSRTPGNNSLLSTLADIEENDSSDEDFIDVAFLPDPDQNDTEFFVEQSVNSDISENSDNFDESDIIGGNYHYFRNKYDHNQKLLEPNHVFRWDQGEYKFNESVQMDEEIFLSEEEKARILRKSPSELFELFVSEDFKQYIIDATVENGYDLSMDQLNTFFGILVTTIINSRKHERDYWSERDIVRHEMISSVMSRNEYLAIKRFLKLSKESDKNPEDRVWRVRSILNMFRKNLQQFGFFSSKLSIDESMIKFFGRSIIKQFMRNKPIRFGLKLWCVCSVSGFLFDFDIYCGKGGESHKAMENLNLGSKVVMLMLHNLLATTPTSKLNEYHICFDNFFTSPDLVVHLKNLGLKATGTVRHNRVYENIETTNEKGKKTVKKVQVPISIAKNSPRGTSDVKHDRLSNTNFISVQDSKIVSVLSSAVGVTPKIEVKRYSSNEKKKIDIEFPRGIKLYNRTMGGVDLYDQHCNDLNIKIKSKKWTFLFLLRLIETALSNSTVLYNSCTADKKKSTYEFADQVANHYLNIRKMEIMHEHVAIDVPIQRVCNQCSRRTCKYCFECKKHFCKDCFNILHNKHETETRTAKRKCINNECNARTQKYCLQCETYICKNCFKGNFHKRPRRTD